MYFNMKSLCESLSLILGLSLAPQAVHGAALKSGIEAITKKSSPHVTVAFRCATLAFILRAHYRNCNIRLFNQNNSVEIDEYSSMGRLVTWASCGLLGLYATFSENSSVLSKCLGMGALFVTDKFDLKLGINASLIAAIRRNDNAAIQEFTKGIEGVSASKKALGDALAITKNVEVAKLLVAAGAATTAAGHKALVEKHPHIAQQIFTPRQKALIAQLSQLATATSKTTGSAVTQRLPRHVAAHIASFDTGITIKQPASAATTAALTATDKLKPDVSNLDEILDAALKEWD
jgi:hypothetical protein